MASAGLPSDLIIRTLRQEDCDAVRKLWAAGMHELAPAGAAHAMSTPKFVWWTAVLSTLGASNRVHPLIPVGIFAGSAIACWWFLRYMVYGAYVKSQSAPTEDMANLVDYYLKKGSSRHFWVAELRGKVVGAVGLDTLEIGAETPNHSLMYKPTDGTTHVAELRRMTVDPSCRGLGIGGQLVQTLKKFAQEEAKVKQVVLDVSKPQEAAIRLYLRHGFRNVRNSDWYWGFFEVQTFILDL